MKLLAIVMAWVLAACDAGGGAASSDAPLAGTIDAPSSSDGSVDAEVDAPGPLHTLTIVKSGAGTGTVTSARAGISCGGACSAAYPAGTTVTLTATPTASSSFYGWSGGGCTGSAPCTVTLAAATTVEAVFHDEPPMLLVHVSGSGSGTVVSTPAGIDCGVDCSEAFLAGTSITLSAHTSLNSTFSGWSGPCTGTGNCVITLNAIENVTATFALTRSTLTVVRAGTGTGVVSSSPNGIMCGGATIDCSEDYDFGTSVTLTATPLGATFAGWSGGGCTGTGPCTVTVTAAATVTATFTDTTSCDSFTAANGTTVAGWTERAGDWFIDGNRLRNSVPGGVYTDLITKDGSTFADGCVRFTGLHTGAQNGQVAGAVLRWTSAASYLVAVVQDNSFTGNFNSLWIYQFPGSGSLAQLALQNFGVSPRVEVCTWGTTVIMRIDADQDGTYELTKTAQTSIAGPGLAGVVTKADAAVIANMPRVDDVCAGP